MNIVLIPRSDEGESGDGSSSENEGQDKSTGEGPCCAPPSVPPSSPIDSTLTEKKVSELVCCIPLFDIGLELCVYCILMMKAEPSECALGNRLRPAVATIGKKSLVVRASHLAKMAQKFQMTDEMVEDLWSKVI